MSSNITPDRTYGIGQYTYEDFARAVCEGVARGGKRLYPAMPYASFAKVSNDDMHALYTYMMHGVSPVTKPTPRSDVSFPFTSVGRCASGKRPTRRAASTNRVRSVMRNGIAALTER